MDFLDKTYIDNGITYYIDVEALSVEIDLRRGEEGVEKFINSLPDSSDMPKGRTVLDWIKKTHGPRYIEQLKCLLDALSIEYERVMIPEDVVLDPDYERKKLIERELKLNEVRKRLGLDAFFFAHYLFYFGSYRISPFNMKRVFDGKMIAPREFLDDVEELIKRYDKEPVYSEEFKPNFKWSNSDDRCLRNKFKIIFPGYELVSKVLRY